MSMTLQNLRDELRVHLGVDELDLPNAEADLLLNRVWWDVADKNDFREKEKQFIFPTIAGTRDYLVSSVVAIGDTFDAIRGLSIVNPNNDSHIPVEPMMESEYEGLFVNSVDREEMPTRYVRFGSTLRLWPTPDQVYSMVLRYWVTLPDLLSGGPVIPQSWHEIILYGAVKRGYERTNSDLERASYFKQEYTDMLNNAVPVRAKEQKDRRQASVNVYRPKPRY